jgi:NADH:ubiquinone oxidoreductase subunit 2 (subunit N)
VQYFIIGSIPSGMLVFSLALMYKAWGTLALADIDVMLNDMFTTKIQPTISPLFNETKREHAKLQQKN